MFTTLYNVIAFHCSNRWLKLFPIFFWIQGFPLNGAGYPLVGGESHIGNRGGHGLRAGSGSIPTRRSHNNPLPIITRSLSLPLQPSDINSLSKRGIQNYYTGYRVDHSCVRGNKSLQPVSIQHSSPLGGSFGHTTTKKLTSLATLPREEHQPRSAKVKLKSP